MRRKFITLIYYRQKLNHLEFPEKGFSDNIYQLLICIYIDITSNVPVNQ